MKPFLMYFHLLALIFFLFSEIQQARNDNYPKLKGEYLGMPAPKDEPELFAPGIISNGLDELFGTFSPEGDLFYYIIAKKTQWNIMEVVLRDGEWQKPKIASFSHNEAAKFCLSPDGNTIVLTDFRRLSGEKKTPSMPRVWILSKNQGKWGVPRYIHGLDGAFAPSLSKRNTLFFHIRKKGQQDLYYSLCNNGTYASPIRMGPSVNSVSDEADPFIAPDESYLLFSSNRKSGRGIYISFKDADNRWTHAVALASRINKLGNGAVNVGSVSPDGKYLFLFTNQIQTSHREKRYFLNSNNHKQYMGPGNGSIDIYWVSADVIRKRREEVFNQKEW